MADIHGNDVALTAVLEAGRRSGVEHWLVAGDVVGYYYRPAACLKLLAGVPTSFVRGNHEDLLDESDADSARADALHKQYGSGLRVASATLDASTRGWMATWPREWARDLGSCRVRMCHGTPWDTAEYAYPDASTETWARMAADGDHLLVFGHTHYRTDRLVGQTRIVNPGSVGQARDGAGGACWGTFDTEGLVYRPHVTPYDREAVARDVRLHDPHLPYLERVLFRESTGHR